MTKTLAEQRFDAALVAANEEEQRLRDYNRRRFYNDCRKYGNPPARPAPLPPKKPTAFPEPTKYEERNGG